MYFRKHNANRRGEEPDGRGGKKKALQSRGSGKRNARRNSFLSSQEGKKSQKKGRNLARKDPIQKGIVKMRRKGERGLRGEKLRGGRGPKGSSCRKKKKKQVPEGALSLRKEKKRSRRGDLEVIEKTSQ